MDASKLRNSCICGNTRPYLECCGPFAEPPSAGGLPASRLAGPDGRDTTPQPAPDRPVAAPPASSSAPDTDFPPAKAPPAGWPSASDRFVEARVQEEDDGLYYGFRHCLHELSMALFPLRALYQAYWEKIGKEEYPHDLLMEDPDYGRAVLEDFFWDYFVQYSDARPILRTARELEAKDLRLAHDLMQWSYAPFWFYRVEERTGSEARLRNLGNGKVHRVRHADRLPMTGSGVITRLLPFRGKEFCGHAVLPFHPSLTPERLEAMFRGACRDLKVKPSVTMRPDVHCEEWRRHGSVFLALWRAETYDARVGRPMTPSQAAGSRAPSPAPAIEAAIRDLPALAAELTASAPEVKSAGANQWDLRFRALKLARLESKGGFLSATLADPGFRGYVRDWMRTRLERAVSVSDTAAADPIPGEGMAEVDAWVHAPLEVLNGQSPIQASAHDWGRRRLQIILRDMMKQGRDVTSLRRQLGL